MKFHWALLLVACCSAPICQSAENHDWPSYNGDFTGRRFSSETQINAANVARLSLAWQFKINMGLNPGLFGRVIKSTPVASNGVLYFTVPDNCWAISALSGKEVWHFTWPSQGGIHIGNRGVAVYKDSVYFATPDNHLIALDARTGKLRWAVVIADTKLQYFSTAAPLLIGNHLIMGVGGDSLGVPGYLEARDPATGAVQWRWNSEPSPGQAGAETWPDGPSMAHGGGMPWMPGTYDPELNLLFWGTGNPVPAYAGNARQGSNLWTGSIVALNADTGQMKWWFQASPHDTHDWDAVQTPVLIDDIVDGKPRKLLAQASRNGYFYLLDRVTGDSLLSKPYIKTNWSTEFNKRGEVVPLPEKEPKPDGVLVSPRDIGATNWQAPSFDPQTGLFYVSAAESYSVFYLTDTDAHPEGFAGFDNEIWAKPMLKAINYKSAEVVWTHVFPNRGAEPASLLTTAGNLLFSGDQSNNFIAFDPANGRTLWHYRMNEGTSNGPVTYRADGTQFVVVAGKDTLYAFALTHPE